MTVNTIKQCINLTSVVNAQHCGLIVWKGVCSKLRDEDLDGGIRVSVISLRFGSFLGSGWGH